MRASSKIRGGSRVLQPNVKPDGNERGAVAVEFALMAPILLLVLFAIISYGRLFSEIQVMNAAAREGGRVASVWGSPDEITDAVRDAAAPYTVTGAISFGTCADGDRGEFVTVSWTQSFASLKASLPFPLPMPDNQQIKGVFRCE